MNAEEFEKIAIRQREFWKGVQSEYREPFVTVPQADGPRIGEVDLSAITPSEWQMVWSKYCPAGNRL